MQQQQLATIRPFDRFLTDLWREGRRVGLCITDDYEDGFYGGHFYHMDDPHAITLEHVEEISAADIRQRGWILVDGPSLLRTASH